MAEVAEATVVGVMVAVEAAAKIQVYDYAKLYMM